MQANVASVMCSYSESELNVVPSIVPLTSCLSLFADLSKLFDSRVSLILTWYGLVNGTYACEHDGAINGLLKGELGFQGCESTSPNHCPKIDLCSV